MNARNRIVKYEASSYGSSIYKADFFAENLCVTNEEVEFEAFRAETIALVDTWGPWE